MREPICSDSKSSVLIIVPARGGSKRIPGKNLRAFAGRPLLDHTADAIMNANLNSPCLLSTDDEAIATRGRELGWLVPFMRPQEFATDSSPTIDTVLHALDWFCDDRSEDPNLVMVLQPTSPLRGHSCLVDALQLLSDNSEAEAVIGMCEHHVPAKFLYTFGKNGFALPLTLNEGNESVLAPNGAVYLARTEAVRRERSLFPERILALVMDRITSIDIDTELDFQMAETLQNVSLGMRSGETTAGKN